MNNQSTKPIQRSDQETARLAQSFLEENHPATAREAGYKEGYSQATADSTAYVAQLHDLITKVALRVCTLIDTGGDTDCQTQLPFDNQCLACQAKQLHSEYIKQNSPSTQTNETPSKHTLEFH